MRIVRKTSQQQIADLPKEQNYLVVDKDNTPLKMIINQYKTQKDYGQYVEDEIPETFQDTLKFYITEAGLKTGDPLFGTRAGTEYASGSYANVVTSTMNELLGRRVGINTLRHSKIAHFFSDREKSRVIANKDKLAAKMGHSTQMQAIYDRLTSAEDMATFNEDREKTKLENRNRVVKTRKKTKQAKKDKEAKTAFVLEEPKEEPKGGPKPKGGGRSRRGGRREARESLTRRQGRSRPRRQGKPPTTSGIAKRFPRRPRRKRTKPSWTSKTVKGKRVKRKRVTETAMRQCPPRPGRQARAPTPRRG